MFLDCPAYLDQDGTVRCGLPAEVRCRFTMRSTDGPLESAMISCPVGHWFNGPLESLTWNSTNKHAPGTAGAAPTARRHALTSAHDGHDGSGGFTAQDVSAEPERGIPRSNNAPAHYLGRPARLWITAMHPRRRRTASTHLMSAVTGGYDETPPRTPGPLSATPLPEKCTSRH
jgi:hypothetical protein